MATYAMREKMNSHSFACDILKEIYDKPAPVFLCVGSSRCVADSLGPLVGEYLTKKHNIATFVYGNLEKNIDRGNLSEYVEFVKEKHGGSPVIVVDSCLGASEEIGSVKFHKGSLFVAGINNGVLIGDYGLSAIVNTTGITALNFLRGTTIKTILKLAAFISQSIAAAIHMSQTFQTNVVSAN